MSSISPFAARRDPYYYPYSYDVFDPFREYNNFRSTTLTPPLYHKRMESSSSFSSAGVEWSDTPQAHVFKAHVPGFKKEDIRVYIEDGKILKISGEKNIEVEEKNEHNGYYQVQRHSKSQFMNQFVLPQNVRVDQLRSSVDNGMLIVTVPKRDVNGHHEHHQHERSIDLK